MNVSSSVRYSVLVFKRRRSDRETDDSYINVKGAKSLGWTSVHFVEPGVSSPQTPASAYQISDLEELRDIFPEFFKA
jgi:hypothetical protein